MKSVTRPMVASIGAISMRRASGSAMSAFLPTGSAADHHVTVHGDHGRERLGLGRWVARSESGCNARPEGPRRPASRPWAPPPGPRPSVARGAPASAPRPRASRPRVPDQSSEGRSSVAPPREGRPIRCERYAASAWRQSDRSSGRRGARRQLDHRAPARCRACRAASGPRLLAHMSQSRGAGYASARATPGPRARQAAALRPGARCVHAGAAADRLTGPLGSACCAP